MPKKAKQTQASFAEQYAELEKIVSEFEQDGLSLDEGLKKFERGLYIAGKLRKTLREAENSIEKLKEQYHLNEENNDTETGTD